MPVDPEQRVSQYVSLNSLPVLVANETKGYQAEWKVDISKRFVLQTLDADRCSIQFYKITKVLQVDSKGDLVKVANALWSPLFQIDKSGVLSLTY